MSFQDLGLPQPILKALADEGYTAPTPIQRQAIPVVLAGRDLLGIAQTGTGKTAAFALPILARLDADRRPAPRRGCRVLVLSPTRELATQIGASFKTYGRHLGVRVAVVFGGVGMRGQIEALSRGVDVLVATPGRLIDHLDNRNVIISATEVFVLDEADQMLDLGFVRPIRKVVGHLSSARQNLFFSATMPGEIAKLADELLVQPVKAAVAPVATTAERVRQRVIHIEHARKRDLLVELLGDPAMARALVFTRTKRGADRVAQHLDRAGIDAAAIHGNKSQRQREEALDSFKSSAVRVLVATDIAARGIDIDAVSHVVNFELPEVPEAYVHRIGRTARAGAAGEAISLCDSEERDLLRAIERLTRQAIAAEDRRNGQPAAGARASTRAEGRASRSASQRGRNGGRDTGLPPFARPAGREAGPTDGRTGVADPGRRPRPLRFGDGMESLRADDRASDRSRPLREPSVSASRHGSRQSTVLDREARAEGRRQRESAGGRDHDAAARWHSAGARRGEPETGRATSAGDRHAFGGRGTNRGHRVREETGRERSGSARGARRGAGARRDDGPQNAGRASERRRDGDDADRSNPWRRHDRENRGGERRTREDAPGRSSWNRDRRSRAADVRVRD